MLPRTRQDVRYGRRKRSLTQIAFRQLQLRLRRQLRQLLLRDRVYLAVGACVILIGLGLLWSKWLRARNQPVAA